MAKKKSTKKKTSKKAKTSEKTTRKVIKKSTGKKKVTKQAKSTGKKTGKKKAPVLTHQMIADRAYRVYEQSGYIPGRDHYNWQEAERQLRIELGLD